MRSFLYIVGFLIVHSAFAQSDESGDQKLGIKTSISAASLFGSELVNPRPKFGYAAGAYFSKNGKKKWGVYTELLGNFKGSKFSNGDTGYSRIALLYVDAAVLPKYSFSSEHDAALGLYTSYLALSSLFVGGQQAAEANNLDLKPFDFGIAAYFIKKGNIASFQFGTKVGLVDINDGINFEGVKPATGTGGFIRSVGLEIGMIF